MNSRDLVFPAFFGDALSLGAHWIYDADEIRGHFPEGIRSYAAPQTSYHIGKDAGDFTHYGDQTLVLLESVAKRGGFEAAGWAEDWQAFWKSGADSYRDGSTRRTLDNLAAGLKRPSDSQDLGGASRLAALFALPDLQEAAIVRASREQAALTHGPMIGIASEFFARATCRVLGGAGFREAFREAEAPLSTGASWRRLEDAERAAAGSPEDLESLGLSCDVTKAFPLTVALALRHEDSPAEGLRENVALGGDSAARGLLLGLLLGAKHGIDAFPTEWLTDLRARDRIESALGKRVPA